MSDDDREMFPCDLDAFEWDKFVPTYVRGMRAYILKEPMDIGSIERSKRQHYWFKIANRIVKMAFAFFWAVVLVVLYKTFAQKLSMT